MPRLPASADELLQPPEVLAVPLGQVELVAAIRGSRACRCGPRAEQIALGGRERVPLDLERTDRLAVGPAERAGEIEAGDCRVSR